MFVYFWLIAWMAFERSMYTLNQFKLFWHLSVQYLWQSQLITDIKTALYLPVNTAQQPRRLGSSVMLLCEVKSDNLISAYKRHTDRYVSWHYAMNHRWSHRLAILDRNVFNNDACIEQVYSVWSSHAGDYGSQSVGTIARLSRWLGPTLERLQFSHGKATPVPAFSLPCLLCRPHSRKKFYKPIPMFGKFNALLTDCILQQPPVFARLCYFALLYANFIDQCCHLLWYSRNV